MAGKSDLNNLESTILGTMYGNCIGDAIGLLTEFMPKSEAKTYYGEHAKKNTLEYEHKVPDFHRARWKNGDWTDDSDQMILILESILEKDGKVDPVHYAEKLLFWNNRGFPELGDFGGMGIGATTHKVLHHKSFKEDPHHAAEEVWIKSGKHAAPNGAVMRTSVLGLYKYDNIEEVISNCLAICKVTHADPRCQASCIAVCCAIAFMMQKDKKHYNKKKNKYEMHQIITDSFDQAKQVFSQSEKKDIKELESYMFITNIKKLELDEHDKIGYTYKTLGAGFWALKQDDFRKALTEVLMQGGDADTNGAVAGALLGCKLGLHRLPSSWLDNLVHKQWLDNKIFRFLKAHMPDVEITQVKYVEEANQPLKKEEENDRKDEPKRQRILVTHPNAEKTTDASFDNREVEPAAAETKESSSSKAEDIDTNDK